MHDADKRISPATRGRRPSEPDDRDGATLGSLTLPERQVLSLVVNGHTTKQIAAKLGLSPRAINVHRVHIRMKMSSSRMVDLVTLALLHNFDD